MFSIINENDNFDFTSIDYENSIIICDPGNTKNRKSLDGKFDMYSAGTIDPTIGRSLFNGSVSEFVHFPRVKISCPASIHIKFDKPVNSTYHNQIYGQSDMILCGNDKDSPTHIIYNKFKLIIYFDLYRLRNDFKVPQLQKAIPLTSIKFEPYYYIGYSDNILARCHTYYIKNEEVFKKFEEIIE